jgi:hypothetical protein
MLCGYLKMFDSLDFSGARMCRLVTVAIVSVPVRGSPIRAHCSNW